MKSIMLSLPLALLLVLPTLASAAPQDTTIYHWRAGADARHVPHEVGREARREARRATRDALRWRW